MAESVIMHDERMMTKRMLRDDTILVWCSLFCMHACMVGTAKLTTGGTRTARMKRTWHIWVKMRLKVVPQKTRKLVFDDIVR